MKLSHLAAGLLITSVGAAGCLSDGTEQSDDQAITAAECRATPGAPECQIYGTVVDAFIGEMDPFVVGDVCVLFVQKDDSDKLYGLVEDIDLCSSTGRYSERAGAKVYFSKGQITYIADKEARDELKSYQEAVYHYLEGEVFDAS